MANMNPDYLNLSNECPSTVHSLKVRRELDTSESIAGVYAEAYVSERHVVEPSLPPKVMDAETKEALDSARENLKKLYEKIEARPKWPQA